MQQITKKRVQGALLGLATGDAFGVPLEFLTRKQVRALNVRDMVGCDTLTSVNSRWGEIVPAGAWSDDTSLTVAAMEAIIDSGGKIDYERIMQYFSDWWRYGKYTSTGVAFGLGGTTGRALKAFEEGFPLFRCGGTSFEDNGNGSLMRILPFSLYVAAVWPLDEWVVNIIDDGSSITHAHQISSLGCVIFTSFFSLLLLGVPVEDAWEMTRGINYRKYYNEQAVSAYNVLLAKDGFAEEDIGETGYVVDTLMTAVYAMRHSHDYESAILTAVNMGFDTDTAGAVTGALAGAFYGLESIPDRWLDRLLRRDYLTDLGARFASAIGAEE